MMSEEQQAEFEIMAVVHMRMHVHAASQEAAEKIATEEMFKAVVEAADSGNHDAFGYTVIPLSRNHHSLIEPPPPGVVRNAALKREHIHGLIRIPLEEIQGLEQLRDLASQRLAHDFMDELRVVLIAIDEDHAILEVGGIPAAITPPGF